MGIKTAFMMGTKHAAWLGLLLGAFAAQPALAAADAPMLVASATTPRFMSLAPVRGGMNGVRVERPVTSQATRSDSAALRQGFMRMDRARIDTVTRQGPRALNPAAMRREAEPVRVITGTDKAVLDLFGETSAPAAAQPAARSVGRTAHAWPIAANVQQRVSSGFGSRKDPFHGRPAFHGGVDIAAATGTSVLASADGVVSAVEHGARLGKYVSVKHRDGTESTYGHLSAQSVRNGQTVRQGQKLGEVGSTGRSTGPHLDYRIKKNGELFNPMTVLREPGTGSTRVASNSSTINGVKIIR